jgi:hypothetical protein
MTSTEPMSPRPSGAPTVGDLLADTVPVIDTVFVAGPPVLLVWGGTVLLALMLAGPFALLAVFVVVLVAAAALVALIGAILASPYLLVRHLRAHSAAHEVTSTASKLVVAKAPQAVA